MKTPAELGYTFPPEWSPHRGTWLSWPRPEALSFPGRYHTIPDNLSKIIREIATREEVHVNVPNANYEHIVRSQLENHGRPLWNIYFHYVKTNECWCRDHGPAFVLKGKKGGGHQAAIVDWGYNALGGKYPPFEDDDAVPTRIAELLRLEVFHPAMILEGGSVDFNGAGTVLTTESCLLNKNRNPNLSKKQIERHLCDFYGQKHVCWLGEGIVGDDTDGHVDDLARFISPTTIVAAVEQDPQDVNYKALRDNRHRLELLRDQDGRPFEIVDLPMPGVVEYENTRLPATYANFYFVNGAVLVPTYRHKKHDAKAVEILQKRLPDRKVVGVDCYDLIWGRGAIHCLTQQMPQF